MERAQCLESILGVLSLTLRGLFLDNLGAPPDLVLSGIDRLTLTTTYSKNLLKLETLLIFQHWFSGRISSKNHLNKTAISNYIKLYLVFKYFLTINDRCLYPLHFSFIYFPYSLGKETQLVILRWMPVRYIYMFYGFVTSSLKKIQNSLYLKWIKILNEWLFWRG